MTNKSNSTQQWMLDLILLTIGLSIFYALWLGSHALFTPDEGRYSEVAREMLVTHDFITPRLNGVVFFDKPILYYWLQASAIHLFGLKEWALRFWPALLGVLGCLMTYITGHLLFNRRVGLISAVILATAPLYYGAAHYANLDLEVASLVSISLMSFIVGIHSSARSKTFFLMLAYLFSALAVLTKGLIGIAFPAMIIGAWIVLSNRWNTLTRMHLFSGLILFAVVALPWYILVQQANPEFFQFFFVKQQVSRFLTTEHFNNRTPAWFYIPIVFMGLFPWCAFVIQAIYQQIKLVWKNRSTYNVELYLLIWFISIFIFFSIPKSKTIGYILPIFPALALLIGKYLSDHWDALTRSMRSGVLIFFMLALGGAIACFALPYSHLDYPRDMDPYLMINGILLLTASGVIGILMITKSTISRVVSAIALTGVLFLLTVAASSDVINQKTIKPLAAQLRTNLHEDDEIVAFYKYFQDLPIYLERRITIVADWNAKDIPLKDNWLRELWYGMPFQDTKEWLISEETFWQRWNSDKRLYVFTDMSNYKTLQKKSAKPVFKIAHHNKTILLSNKPSQ